VLLRLVYLGTTNVFALLRLLPVSDRDKDAEILALRHQITVLERQLGTTRTRFSPADRAFLAALLHRLPAMYSAGSGSWCARTRYCAGAGTSWPWCLPKSSSAQVGATIRFRRRQGNPVATRQSPKFLPP